MLFIIMAIVTSAMTLLSLGHVIAGNVLASTIEIPTYNTSTFSITGTRTIDYTDEIILAVPYKNSTASIGVEEYRQCVINSNQMVIKSVNEDAENIKYLQALGMEGCIIFNSGKQ